MSNKTQTPTTRPDLIGNKYAYKPGLKKAIRITVDSDADYELIMALLETPEMRGSALVSAARILADSQENA